MKSQNISLTNSQTKQQPKQLDFASIGNRVMRGAEWICTARSHTFAKRIVNALRKHIPNDRGE
jgi:hypothetical protein